MKEGKSFQISQNEVLNAYKVIKTNKGASGVDGVELEEFDIDWKNRLYKLWNRLSSGTYFPKPVRGVEIPKKMGRKDFLGYRPLKIVSPRWYYETGLNHM